MQQPGTTPSTTPATWHRCAAKHCRQSIEPQFLFCLDHWRQVPQDLQGPIFRCLKRGDYWTVPQALVDQAVAAIEGADA